jgi:hypothetical protein
VRYGERTARGIAGGKNVCWAFTLGEKSRVRSGKRIIERPLRRDVMEDIALLNPQVRHRHQLHAGKMIEGGVSCAYYTSHNVYTAPRVCEALKLPM